MPTDFCIIKPTSAGEYAAPNLQPSRGWAIMSRRETATNIAYALLAAAFIALLYRQSTRLAGDAINLDRITLIGAAALLVTITWSRTDMVLALYKPCVHAYQLAELRRRLDWHGYLRPDAPLLEGVTGLIVERQRALALLDLHGITQYQQQLPGRLREGDQRVTEFITDEIARRDTAITQLEHAAVGAAEEAIRLFLECRRAGETVEQATASAVMEVRDGCRATTELLGIPVGDDA